MSEINNIPIVHKQRSITVYFFDHLISSRKIQEGKIVSVSRSGYSFGAIVDFLDAKYESEYGYYSLGRLYT